MPAIAEVRKNLSRLGDRVVRGETVYVTRHGRRRFKMVPLSEEEMDEELGKAAIRALKQMKGKPWFYVADARDLNKIFG